MTPDTITPQTIECTLCLLGIVGMIASYLYGRARTERKYKKQLQVEMDEIERLSDIELLRDKQVDNWRLNAEHWKGKYNLLQQEIETHVHEVHEEVERPHISWEESEDSFWESPNRMRDNDQ